MQTSKRLSSTAARAAQHDDVTSTRVQHLKARAAGRSPDAQAELLRPERPVQLRTDEEEQAATPTIDGLAASLAEVAPAAQREYALENIPLILRQAIRQGVSNAQQVAYLLATTQHESRFGQPLYGRSESLVEDRNPYSQGANGGLVARNHVTGGQSSGANAQEMEQNYWDDAYGGRLGNAAGTSDGATFRGRGFVQITGRENYQKMSRALAEHGFTYTHDGVTYGTEENPIDLVANPTHVNEVPELAAALLVDGAIDGRYTGLALGDYVNDEETDFYNARAVINGDKEENGQAIATLARTYAAVLTADDAWQTLYIALTSAAP